MCLYKDLSENCPNNSIFRTMLRHCRNIVLSTQMLSEERHAPVYAGLHMGLCACTLLSVCTVSVTVES